MRFQPELIVITILFHIVHSQLNVKLLECFEYKKNYWLVGFAFHTTSVQFKDECLRHCLSASLRGTVCLSAMHVPGDDRCVLADEDQLTRPDLFLENDAHQDFTVNYFRNTCVDPPGEAGGRLQARLLGYRGGQGLLELAQQRGKNPKIMVVMTGLAPGRDYNIFYAPQLEATMCQKMTSAKKADIGEKLITVDSDTTGMAIQPWTEIDWHILDDSVLEKTVVVIESKSGLVVDCGTIKIKGNQSDWEAAKNVAHSNYNIFACVLTLFSLIFLL